MKLMKMGLAAVAGGMAVNYLLKKTASADGAARADEGTGARSPSVALGPVASGSGPGAFDSPNEAERMLASRPANSLVGSGAESLDPLRSNARDGELARSTGLSDFARGA
jgi:hypothetical protein